MPEEGYQCMVSTGPFKMSHSPNNESGYSMLELLIASAVGIIAVGIAYVVFQNFMDQKWAQESKSAMIDELEGATRLIRTTMPDYVNTVTGNDGTTAPDANFWNCTDGSGCTMDILDPRYSTTTSMRIMEVSCVTNNDSLTSGSLINNMAVDSSIASICGTCSSGFKPIVNIYSYKAQVDAATGVETLQNIGMKTFPSLGSSAMGGMLAMSVCVSAPAYTFNAGTTAAPNNITRYDRWTFTLIPIYPVNPIKTALTSSSGPNFLSMLPDRVIITGDQKLGDSLRFVPTP
jgi:Tfp pilus assembly protein PilV